MCHTVWVGGETGSFHLNIARVSWNLLDAAVRSCSQVCGVIVLMPHENRVRTSFNLKTRFVTPALVSSRTLRTLRISLRWRASALACLRAVSVPRLACTCSGTQIYFRVAQNKVLKNQPLLVKLIESTTYHVVVLYFSAWRTLHHHCCLKDWQDWRANFYTWKQ